MAFILLALFFVLLQHLASAVPLENKASVVIAPYIVGGIEAPETHAPHMIALVFGELVKSLVCGASIISVSCILTAAHCIDAVKNWDGSLMSSASGVFGSNSWNFTENLVKFTHFKNHENWNPSTIKNDIGLLFLKHNLKISDRVALIPLELNYVKAGTKSYVTGWGRLWASGPIPAKLQLLYVVTIGEQRCKRGVLEAAGGWWAPPVDYQIEICTLHPKGEGYGMCNGDSGSALVSTTTRRQIGIVSWGFACARGAPDMFVRVSGFKKWLKKHLKED